MTADADLVLRAINVIRGLAMDAPQAADSGHPGTAMALAPWPTCCGPVLHDAEAPTGPTATASCLSAGHSRSCCTRCSTSPATG